ncbi:hypothetical protein [Vibrio harveyi]|uniref:hypothetical protein n=1 Tax=Vibrio harveyi TaxID=669 RepID=UPI001559743C|nr:hypothetical protein [Vibrio harveyi]MCQ9074850.1 hypothetical protein [Vibrio harveyi]HDM8150557.1 hypothetical protein [Vibrio harveyi]HDM8193170.1 hypothetical protein [Vibrio harveyi]
MSEANPISESNSNEQPTNLLQNINLSTVISSIILGGSLIMSASSLTPNEEPSNIIEYEGGKVEMGRVLSESATFAFAIFDENDRYITSGESSSPSELTNIAQRFFEKEIKEQNNVIDRDNERKQQRFDNDMEYYNRSLEKYNEHLSTLEKGEEPKYDAPEKPVLEPLEKKKKLNDLYFTIDGYAKVTAAVEFNGTITSQFTLELDTIEKHFTSEDKLSIVDMIEFIEDTSDDLYSDYEDESLVD